MVQDDTPTVEIVCEVSKVQTLADGGIRLTLDLPEQAIPQAALLMDCKRRGVPLFVQATPQED
jgi:hypothetical protein